MKKQFLVLLAVLFLLVSCRYEENLDVATTENSHKSLTDATFHELSKTTKLLDVSSLMAKSSDFVDDYLATDYLIDTTQIKKTIKNGEITEFAVFLSKKNEMQTGVFYNLVLTKRKNEWKKYLLKLTPCLLLGSDSKVGYKCEFISKKAQTLKCGSTFYMVEYFSCPAGHTDPSDGDCNGCWNLTSYGATNTCDEEAPDDFLATGGTYGGGTTPNIDGLINAYADSSHLNLYYQLSTENRFKCYQALILSGDTAMVNFSIDFFYNNPTTTIQQFQNWFMEPSEGKDGEGYDSAYWDDPNLTFPTQNLPSWQNYYNAFPKDSNGKGLTGPTVYNLVGGVPKAMRDGVLSDSDPNNDQDFDNACALRVSRALNYSGVIIPNLPNQTFKGADGKYYFLSAKKLNTWMRKTFGTNPATSTTPYNPNHINITGSQAGVHGVNLPNLLGGKKGIYSLVSSNSSWASGHGDILQPNGTCINGCHFFDAPIAYIDVWILQ